MLLLLSIYGSLQEIYPFNLHIESQILIIRTAYSKIKSFDYLPHKTIMTLNSCSKVPKHVMLLDKLSRPRENISLLVIIQCS